MQARLSQSCEGWVLPPLAYDAMTIASITELVRAILTAFHDVSGAGTIDYGKSESLSNTLKQLKARIRLTRELAWPIALRAIGHTNIKTLLEEMAVCVHSEKSETGNPEHVEAAGD